MEWIDLLYSLTTLVSFVVNVILLVCNYRRGEGRWSTDGILITINALLDSILAAYAVSSTLVRIQYPSTIFRDSLWCHITLFIERALSTACLNTVMLLALVRYLVIVHKTNPYPRFWAFVAFGLILALLILAGICSRDSKLYVYPSGMYCYPVFSRLENTSKAVYLFYLIFYIPHLLIISFCYLRISWHYQQLLRAREFRATTGVWGKILGLFVVVLAYWVSIIPHIVIVNIVNPNITLDGLFYWFKGCFLLINALFPVLFHLEIQDNFKQLFSLKESHQ
ncbi:Galanin-like G-protein coupled receptor npr-9 [Entomophthora muscae]|uniref:Galanin-like G-protein coupled receptor npr-9 n=1 Tax=Entomophthora muscae TaxID=34485 RepID=A0ACC2T828_9FUNG|nr:Galanin-like G-protein coupled receptor npr-9 [Entomophthora muscae]